MGCSTHCTYRAEAQHLVSSRHRGPVVLIEKADRSAAARDHRESDPLARKSLGDEVLRQNVVATGKSLKAGVKALRRALRGPQDAAGAPEPRRQVAR
jgi:hypothetical protein